MQFEELTEEVEDAQQLCYLIEKMEPPYTPATFTLWRRVALKRVRKEVLGLSTTHNIDQDLELEVVRKCRAVMNAFTTRVDCETLDKPYLHVITDLYQNKLRSIPATHETTNTSGSFVPQGLLNFDRYMEVLKESSSYEKLVRCLSQWLALMELCDDLLERLYLYGHAQYLDVKHAQETLR